MSKRRGSGHTFIVTATLGTGQFDTERLAAQRLKGVMTEVRRIRRADRRVRDAKLHPLPGGAGGRYRLDLTIVAASSHEAFDVASGVVRASIHSAGGSTAGWETNIRPQLPPGELRRAARPSPPSSWAGASAAAAHQLATIPALPSFDPTGRRPVAPVPQLVSSGVIDLR